MEELVTIAEFNSAQEAHLLRARLGAEGIESYLINENMNTMLGIGLGAVKLQVRLRDSFKAMDVLFEQDGPDNAPSSSNEPE